MFIHAKRLRPLCRFLKGYPATRERVGSGVGRKRKENGPIIGSFGASELSLSQGGGGGGGIKSTLLKGYGYIIRARTVRCHGRERAKFHGEVSWALVG